MICGVGERGRSISGCHTEIVEGGGVDVRAGRAHLHWRLIGNGQRDDELPARFVHAELARERVVGSWGREQ